MGCMYSCIHARIHVWVVCMCMCTCTSRRCLGVDVRLGLDVNDTSYLD